MKPADFLKALGVAIAVLVITLAASFFMVAFYAFFIEPGHPQDFYNDAAQWLAPWSSHILGPILFFVLNYRLAKQSAKRNAIAFAITSFVLYVLVDFSMLPAMGMDIRTALNSSMAISLLAKFIGALLGAHIGYKKAVSADE